MSTLSGAKQGQLRHGKVIWSVDETEQSLSDVGPIFTVCTRYQ